MNDKLEQLYNLYKQNGIIQSTDFNTFSTADDNQRKKLYDLGKQKGLFKTTDYNTFSSAFSPVKKKEPTVSPSPSGQKPTSSGTPAKKPSGQSGSLSKPDGIYIFSGRKDATYKKQDGNWFIDLNGSGKFFPIEKNKEERIKILEKSSERIYNSPFEEVNIEYKKAPVKPVTAKPTDEQTVQQKAFNEDFIALDKNDSVVLEKDARDKRLEKTLYTFNEKVVGALNETDFKDNIKKVLQENPETADMFDIEETGAGYDAIRVRNKYTGEFKDINLNNWSAERNKDESELLKAFIKVNSKFSDLSKMKSKLSNIQQERKDMVGMDAIDADKEIARLRDGIKLETKLRNNYVLGDKYMASAVYDENSIKNMNAKIGRIQVDSIDIREQQESLNEWKNKAIEAVASGKMSKEQFDTEYLPNIEAEQDVITKKASGMMSEINTIMSDFDDAETIAGLNTLAQSERGNVLTGAGKSFMQGVESAVRYTFENTTGLDPIKKGTIADQLSAGIITDEYLSSADRNSFESAIFGISNSIGSAAAGILIARNPAAGLFASSYMNMKDQMVGPEWNDVPEYEKILLSSTYGVAISALEKFGLDRVFSKTPIGKNAMNWIMANTFKSLPKGATKEVLENAINENIKIAISRGILNTAGGILVEGGTEGLQEAADYTIKGVYNEIKGNDLFDTPKTISEALSGISEASKLGMIGGGVMSGITQAVNVPKDMMTSKQFNVAVNAITNQNLKDIFQTTLKGKVLSGEITKDDALKQVNAMRSMEATLGKIPEFIPAEKKYDAFKLISERDRLESEIIGYEPELVAAQKERIKEINNELQTISIDATKENNIKQQEGTAEGSAVEYQGVSEGQPEVGQGEGIQREATVNEANTGDSAVESISVKELGAKATQEVSNYISELGSNERIGGTIDSVMAKMNNAEYINDSEINSTIDTIFSEVESINNDANYSDQTKKSLSEKLMNIAEQLDNYEFRTKTETIAVTQRGTAPVAKQAATAKISAEKFFEGQTAEVNGVPATFKSNKGRTEAVMDNGETVVLDTPTMKINEGDFEFDDAGNLAAVTVTDRFGTTAKFTGDIAMDLAIKQRENEIGTVEQADFDTVYKEVETKYVKETSKIKEATNSEKVKTLRAEEQTELSTTAQEGQTIEQEITPESYVEELNNTIESDPETYWSVSPVDLETAKDSTIVGDSDGKGIVSKDGDIKGVFKSLKSKAKGVAEKILSAAVKVGGIKLDNFDGYLTKTYKKNGFRVVARVPFNEEFAPNGWNKEKHGTPDVVAMIYDPEGKLSIEEKSFTDYDEAMAYRDTFVEQARVNKQESESVEQEVEAIGQLLSGTDQQIDQKAAKIANKKISKAVSRAAKAISKIIPDTKFVVHDTNESFISATGEGKTEKIGGIFDPATNTIHINGTNANSRTVAHEVFHAILINKVKTNANAAAVTKRMIQSIASKIDNNPELKKKLEDFISRYEENIQNEEKLSELVGMLAENYNSMSTSIKDLLSRWIDKLASMFGLDPFNRNETYDMLNTIARKVAKGKVISEADVEVLGTGTIEATTATPRQSKFIDSLVFNRFPTNKNTKVLDNFELSTINGQVAASTLSDKLTAGELKKYKTVNGEKVLEAVYTFFGGIGYPEVTGRVWAASTLSAVKKIIDDMKVSSDGYRYLIPAVMSNVSHMSNKNMTSITMEVFKEAIDNKELNKSNFKDLVNTASNRKGLEKFKEGIVNSISGNISAIDMANNLRDYIISSNMTFESRKKLLLSMVGNPKSGNPKFSTVGTFLSLATSLSDPIAKEVNLYQVPVIIRTKGNLNPVKTKKDDEFYHDSYGYHIESDQEIEVLHLDDIYNLTDIIPEFTKSDGTVVSTENELNKKRTKAWDIKKILTNLGRTHGMSKYSAKIVAPKKNEDQATPRKQLSPEVSSKLTEDKKGNFVFHHYSDNRRAVIKPGTGQNIITGKEESSALSAVGGLAMYYTMDNQAEAGVGNTLHTVLIPNGKVYDFNKDPDNFYAEAKKRFKDARPSQSFSPNYQLAFVTQVANENGYDMVVARWKNNELRAQTTFTLEPSKENIPMKPIVPETYNVGDDVEVYGSKGKVTSIEGDIISYKGEGVSGSINFKRFPKNISKQITPRKQITEEVAGIEETISPRKQKAKSINDIVRITKDQGFSDAAIRQYLKDQGFSDKQATDAINEYNVKKEGIFVRKDGGIPTKIVDSIRSFRRRMFSARSFLPKSVFSSREDKDASVARHLNIVDQNVKDFNVLYARYKGTKAEKDKLVEDFDNYIRGDKDVKLPEDFMAVANSMRNQIDGLSMQLIGSGLVDADMAQTIKDNLGQYLTRSYKIYDRANWKKEVENEVKQKAINLLKSQYREMAQEISDKEGIPLDEVLNNLVTNRLDEMLTTEGASNFITGSKLGAKDLSVLKERQDIPIEIRMLLGEYSDPALNYAKTVLKLSSLAANHKFLTEIKKTGMGVYFFEKNDPRRPADFNTMIAAEGSESMNPLNGLYTTKEIADAFMAQPSELSNFWKTFMKFQSSVRWLKTIGSVATHIKNVFGNIGFVWINAHFDPKEVGRAFMMVKNDFSNGTNQQRRDKMNNYISLGIVKQSAGLGEIMDMFKDANWDTAMASRLSNQNLGLLGKAKRFFLQGKKKIEDAYQAEDDFFKIVAYENELSRYSKAMFNKDKSDLTQDELTEVNKVVTEIVKNTYPTYDRIPEAIKMVRRAPFIGNFVSFQAESYRTAFNTIALAKNELMSDNNKIKAIGAQRLAGATTYLSAKSAILSYFSMAAGTGLTGLVGYLFDDDDEEEKDKDIRKFVAPWSDKSDLLMISVGGGKMKYIDFSSSDPHGGMKKVMNAFFLGETTIDSFSEGIAETFAPFIGEDMTVEALLALKNNQDKYGNPIYNSEESLQDQSEKVLSYMYKLVEPGTFSSIRRGWEAEDKTNELVANLTGFRTYDVDINKQFGYKMKDYSERMTNAKKIYNSEYYNEKATPSEKEKAYKKANESLNKIYSEITDVYNSAERLGCNPKDLGVVMSDFGGMSRRDINEIKSGNIPELKKKK